MFSELLGSGEIMWLHVYNGRIEQIGAMRYAH